MTSPTDVLCSATCGFGGIGLTLAAAARARHLHPLMRVLLNGTSALFAVAALACALSVAVQW